MTKLFTKRRKKIILVLTTFATVGLWRRSTLSATVGVVVAVAVAVAMTVAVAEAVLMKEDEADDVDDEACNADVEHPVGVLDAVFVVGQSLDRFNDDREAQSDQEHRVDQSAQHLGTCPAVRVLV